VDFNKYRALTTTESDTLRHRKVPFMPLSTGFNHVATVTADLDRIAHFYQTIFDADITFEMAATADHPRMVVLDLGSDSALNIIEQSADTIVGDRTTAGSRVPIDHTALPSPPAPTSRSSVSG
jgi:catechol 2,3-dioxygenase-like lactoylglutathione lyase family enzyme